MEFKHSIVVFRK